MKKIFLLLISVVISTHSYTQDTIIVSETINLNADFSSFENVMLEASESINLLPGFKYCAQTTGSFSTEIVSLVMSLM